MNVSNTRLTNNQKRVLAKVFAAPTPTVAASEIVDDQNLVSARNILARMGMLVLINNRAEITDLGMQAMKDNALVDDAGQLTQDGQAFAYTDSRGEPDDQQSTPGPAKTLPFAPLQSMPRSGVGPTSFESIALNPVKLKLLKELLSR